MDELAGIECFAREVVDHYESTDEYAVDVAVFGGGTAAEGKAIVRYCADRARWVRIDGHTPYWLSEELVAFAFRASRDPLAVAERIEDVVAEAADKHDAANGRRLLERALEREAYAAEERDEWLRDRENDRRLDGSRGK